MITAKKLVLSSDCGYKTPIPDKALGMTGKPFRFFDNRLKYLTFVNTTNEKWRISERVAQELPHLDPRPPALRVFDAGMGDATVLSNTMRAMHQMHPPFRSMSSARKSA